MAKQSSSYYIMLIMTIFLTAGGIITMLPTSSASKVSMLGYKAYCSFSPISALICFLLAGMVCFIRSKMVKKK
ncbi:hypothetical protein ACFLT9_00815 [Acidobacteriota bacterium]